MGVHLQGALFPALSIDKFEDLIHGLSEGLYLRWFKITQPVDEFPLDGVGEGLAQLSTGFRQTD